MSEIVTDNPIGRANDVLMAKNMAEKLHAAYPGHLWAVHVENNLADVRNLYLSGDWGFRLRIDRTYSASDFDKRVLKAGGELLERYRVRRGKFDSDAHLDLKRTFAGHIVADRG